MDWQNDEYMHNSDLIFNRMTFIIKKRKTDIVYWSRQPKGRLYHLDLLRDSEKGVVAWLHIVTCSHLLLWYVPSYRLSEVSEMIPMIRQKNNRPAPRKIWRLFHVTKDLYMPEQIGICLSPGCLDRYIIKVSNSFVNVVSKTIKNKG